LDINFCEKREIGILLIYVIMTYADAAFYVGVHFAGESSRDLSTPVDPRQHAAGIEVLSRLMGIRNQRTLMI